MAAVVFVFGDYRLDDERVTLAGPDGPVHCEPQVFRVLLHLVQNRHRAVPKEELLDVVWGDRFVSESALTSRIKAARRAVGDAGETQHTIKTVHGVGYHFVAEVEPIVDVGPPTGVASDRGFPALRTELIGRDTDLDNVVTMVRTVRATTIAGPGGVGKTTLAVAAGRLLHGDFADGAIFADLTAARSEADIARTVADAAGVEGDASRSIERLTEHLAARHILIVLDNCEHVLAPAADLVDLVLGRNGDARILATSREPLMVPGEHVWPLAPLTSAGPALFVERARAADPRVAWDPTDPAIVELCQRLDGLPLALELAAGQLRRWGFTELSRQLAGELSVLARRHQRTSRHGTMTAAIDWSYQLLDEAERRLLRQLSIFPSSFDVHSVEALAAPLPGVTMPATLGQLVDKSLVVRDPASDRLRMLETIRVFVREHLDAEGEADDAGERFRLHVLDRAGRMSRLDRWMSGRLAADWRANADQERQAFRASLAAGHIGDAVEIAIGASFLWRNAVGCTEGAAWVDDLLGRELAPTDHVWTLILQADVGLGIGDFGQTLSAVSAAREVDDGTDPAASCIVAHYAALAHLMDPALGPEHLEPVRARAPDPRLVDLIEAMLVVPALAAGGAAAVAKVAEGLERLHAVASEDGYDRFILNWVGWMVGLARLDADLARRWMGRQQDFLLRTGLIETWLTTFSGAMSESVDGTDVRSDLARALALADREGYRAEGDCALALAYSEVCRGRVRDAAELLGTAIASRFNATAHYVLYRAVVEPVVRRQYDAERHDGEDFARAVERGRLRTAREALTEYGIC